MVRGLGAFLILAGLLGALVFAVLGEGGLLPYPSNGIAMIVRIHNLPIQVEIADTPDTRRQGLSGREGIAPNAGMLFVSSEPENLNIWMKDMLFPIDILWLDRDGTIISIKQEATPDSYPTVFQPDRPASFVLELNAGFVESYNVKVGDVVDLGSLVDRHSQ